MIHHQYTVGDLIRFVEAKHNWGNGPGCKRDNGLPLLEGYTGEIAWIDKSHTYRLDKMTNKYISKENERVLYKYNVKFHVTTKSGKKLEYNYYLAQDEIELVFAK